MRIVGIDVGKKQDPSALIAIEGRVLSPRRLIVGADRLPLQKRYTEQVPEMQKFVAGADLIMVDGSGVGEAVCDMLREKVETPVWSVVTTGGDKARVNWDLKAVNVPKASIVQHLVTAIEKGVLCHDVKDIQQKRTLDVLWGEMETFERRGKSIEAALGRHDDLVMALALGLFGFIIAKHQQEEAA